MQFGGFPNFSGLPNFSSRGFPGPRFNFPPGQRPIMGVPPGGQPGVGQPDDGPATPQTRRAPTPFSLEDLSPRRFQAPRAPNLFVGGPSVYNPPQGFPSFGGYGGRLPRVPSYGGRTGGPFGPPPPRRVYPMRGGMPGFGAGAMPFRPRMPSGPPQFDFDEDKIRSFFDTLRGPQDNTELTTLQDRIKELEGQIAGFQTPTPTESVTEAEIVTATPEGETVSTDEALTTTDDAAQAAAAAQAQADADAAAQADADAAAQAQAQADADAAAAQAQADADAQAQADADAAEAARLQAIADEQAQADALAAQAAADAQLAALSGGPNIGGGGLNIGGFQMTPEIQASIDAYIANQGIPTGIPAGIPPQAPAAIPPTPATQPTGQPTNLIPPAFPPNQRPVTNIPGGLGMFPPRGR